jgi:hypothetical protein
MVQLQDVIASAAFRADMQGSNRVLTGEWMRLLSEAIRSTWSLASSARPDFQFSSFDFPLVSGGAASVAVPADFHALIDVVFAPDTTQEYSLGPFAWQNRRSPGGWWPFMSSGVGPGGTRASLRGGLIYVEPAIRATGSYRLWYCPAAHGVKWIVRLATSAPLPACTAAGAGVGKTLTASANAALLIDGVAVVLNDRVLVHNQAATADNGPYTVTQPGTGALPFILTRAVDFDATTEAAVGDIVGVGQFDPTLPVGLLNEGTYWTVSTFTAIEASTVFTGGGALDQILEQFVELVEVKTAIPAMMRDGGSATTSLQDFEERLKILTGEMRTYFAMIRSVTPQKMIDTDAVGAWGSRGFGGW